MIFITKNITGGKDLCAKDPVRILM